MKVLFSIVTLLAISITGSGYAETEEIVYLDMERNNELTKQEISNTFWENPLNTPPMLVLLALIIPIVFVAWKRKWHVHEKTSDLQ